MNIIGDVQGKACILLDDLIDTAGSLCNAAKALQEIGGAKEIYACATHGVLSGPAISRIENSPIQRAGAPQHHPGPGGLRRRPASSRLDVSHIFAEAIRVHLRRGLHLQPVLMLFQQITARWSGSSPGWATPATATPSTRHNVGFRADRAAGAAGWTPDAPARRFHALCGPGQLRRAAGMLLMQPQTFMNLSGQAVAAGCATSTRCRRSGA